MSSFHNAVYGEWEVPSDDTTQAVRRYLYVTPAGLALGDLISIIAYALVGSLLLILVAVLALTGLADWNLARAWRWGLAAGPLPPAIAGVMLLRLILALINAALERILGLDLDQSGQVGDMPEEVIRFVPINRSPKVLENGVDPADLVAFIRGQEVRGPGQKRWRGVRLPSGRRCTDDYHARMIEVLERVGVWRGRGPRVAGELLGGPDEVITLLGLEEYDQAACLAVPANGGLPGRVWQARQ
jgi:hypothetical protein